MASSGGTETKKLSRSRRKKAERAAQEIEREKRISQEKQNNPSQKELEEKELKAKLQPLFLDFKQIPPDGNCLYAAIADQLELQGHQVEKNHYLYLRKLTADYMLRHADEFMPFLDIPSGKALNEGEFRRYCNEIENSSSWGGQLELKALSSALELPILVYTADADSPPIEMGAEFLSSVEPLRLSYHRHAYSLGEHYNSVIPISPIP